MLILKRFQQNRAVEEELTEVVENDVMAEKPKKNSIIQKGKSKPTLVRDMKGTRKTEKRQS